MPASGIADFTCLRAPLSNCQNSVLHRARAHIPYHACADAVDRQTPSLAELGADDILRKNRSPLQVPNPCPLTYFMCSVGKPYGLNGLQASLVMEFFPSGSQVACKPKRLHLCFVWRTICSGVLSLQSAPSGQLDLDDARLPGPGPGRRSSKFKGVSWAEACLKWRTQIWTGNKVWLAHGFLHHQL